MREINEEQYLKVCKKADFIYLHRLIILQSSKENCNFHGLYHAIITDLVEEIYRREKENPTPDFCGIKWRCSKDSFCFSSFGENDPLTAE